MSEGDKKSIQSYVPALVYTMYDGLYIYTPYVNKIPSNKIFEEGTTSAEERDAELKGLKPYVYYSCRYQPNSNSDFIITYSLDNYITIQGKIDGKNWNVAGYLLDGVTKSGNMYSYNGIQITDTGLYKEFILDDGELSYIKENGNKYYKDINGNVFSVISGEKAYAGQGNTFVTNINSGRDQSAINYYRLAYEFTNLVRGNSVLNNLTFDDACDMVSTTNALGNEIQETIKIKDYYDKLDEKDKYTNGYLLTGFSGSSKIFAKENNKFIEESNSNFNEHRTAVIRYAVQKNLSIAIANYNYFSTGSTNVFQMPQLSETDWYSLINNISMISFLQGMPIGGKVYNGYSVVINNKNKEVVAEDSIFITSGAGENGEYHQITSPELR